MSTTPKRGWFYPDGGVANDYPTHMKNLALGLDVVPTDAQGPLSARPAAGNPGAYYFATTNSALFAADGSHKWNVLYRDNGTSWDQLNKTPWLSYAATWAAAAGAPFSTSLIQSPATTGEYRFDANECSVNINQLVQLNGSTGTQAVNVSLPIPAVSDALPTGHAQNHPAEIFLDSTNDVIQFVYGDYSVGQQWVVNAPFWFRSFATYRIS